MITALRFAVLLVGLAASTALASETEPLPGLGLWLSAESLASVHHDGDRVTRWPDRSPHRYDAVFEDRIPQAGLAVGHHHAPTFQSAALAGLPAVSFDARDRDTLILSRAGQALGQKLTGFTAAFVVRPTLNYLPPPERDMAWTERRYLFIDHLSNYDTRFAVQIIQHTGEIRVVSRTVPGEALQRTSSFSDGRQLAVRDQTWACIIASVDYHTRQTCLVIDGQVVNGRLAPTGATAAEDIPSPITGIASSTLGDWLTCQLAELICYERALSPSEVDGLAQALAGKYHLPRPAR